jgi:hypothetical protein
VDPFGTLRRALWIGGGQWPTRPPSPAASHSVKPATDPDPETVWVDPTPEEMAAQTLAAFPIRRA